MSDRPDARLGPRERQIMEIVYRRGRATAEEVRADLPDALTNSAVRGMLRLLEEKGHLRHERDGVRYVYLPARDPEQVRRSRSRRWSTRSSATPPAPPSRRCSASTRTA
jgi:predicted transcriptional regulator